MLNENGIFVFGSLEDAYWELAEASDHTGLKHSFRNLIDVNQKRINYINKLLNIDYCKIYSVVVFSDEIKIMDKFDNSDAYIINYKNLDGLLETIKEAIKPTISLIM